MNLSTIIATLVLAAPANDTQRSPDLQREIIGFDFDLTRIQERPPAALPEGRLTDDDFAVNAIIGRLLQVQQPFDQTEFAANREFYESAQWYLERDKNDGLILGLRKPVQIDPQNQNEQALRNASLQRLNAFGIPAGEIGRVLQRRLMRQDETEGDVTPPKLHRYKTFVLRGINDVEVVGHRAVVTHHLDGSFHRVLVQWPPLADEGHRLTTVMNSDGILAMATAELLNAGETRGRVELRWKYAPTLDDTGHVTLELMVGARLAGVDKGAYFEEPREIDVPVNAR